MSIDNVYHTITDTMIKEINTQHAKLVDRKTAAEILAVSVRTIDRYLNSGKLNKQEIAGRIFIPLKEVNKFSVFRPADLVQLHQTQEYRHPEQEVINHQGTRQSAEPETNHSLDQHSVGESANQAATVFSSKVEEEKISVYKKLFEELQEELKQKQERLEGANYRVGQLEGLLKESIPLIDYKKALAESASKTQELEKMLDQFESSNQQLQNSLEAKINEVGQVAKRLSEERVIKRIFLILLVILFLLQPLWLLLPSAPGL